MIHSGERAFLILCEELNFTRAAERCFMTQQGLSSHIRKLEEQYGTRLFLRAPKVELTESGEALRLALLKKESIEEDLFRIIREIDSGSVGRIHFGINGTRAAYLAPKILNNYCPDYEKVDVHFITGDTETLVRKLREGKLDGLLGVNAMPASDLNVEPLLHEEIFLIMKKGDSADQNADENTGTPDCTDSCSESNCIQELSIRKVAAPHGPVFVRNAVGSTLNTVIDNVLSVHSISLRTQAYISDYNVQLSLCKKSGFAAFCPESLVFAENGPYYDPELQVYRIREIKNLMTISLVTDADRNYPACVEAFFASIKNIF